MLINADTSKLEAVLCDNTAFELPMDLHSGETVTGFLGVVNCGRVLVFGGGAEMTERDESELVVVAVQDFAAAAFVVVWSELSARLQSGETLIIFLGVVSGCRVSTMSS